MVEDFHRGRLAERPIYRRDDGRMSEAHLAGYFAEYDAWSELDRRMVERVSRTVLDVGCGAGRTALWTQERGHPTVGVDRSPGAIRVARHRGLARGVVADLTTLGLRTGFDTVLAVGKQLCLGRSRADLRGTLAELARVTNPGGRLVADVNDPTHPDTRVDPAYLGERTVEPGLAYRRFRVEYDDCAGLWIDLLMASERVLRGIVDGTSWTVESTLRGESDEYAVVLRRA